MLTISKNSKPEISCIYVNYRSAEFLERSLESLFSYETMVPFEVIVINNDEEEQRVVEVLGTKYPLKIKEAFHNPGFEASMNTGAALAEGNILFLVNPDTRWQESFFSEVQEKFNSVKDLGAVGIQLVSPKGIPETKTVSPVFTFPYTRRLEKKEWVSGGALFIPKNVFQEIGGFDEQFFMYFEDMDLCVRIQEAGHKILLHTDQQLIHFGGKSHISKRMQKHLYDQSLYRYTEKHWSLLEHSLFRILHTFYRFFFPYGRR